MNLVTALKTALADAATVTLVDHDGNAHTGTVKEHGLLPVGFFVLTPVVADGRNPLWIFSTLDLAEVIFE